MRNGNSLHGRTILIVQQNWIIATALATAFEARGAQALLAKNALPDLANVPGLAAAVLGSHRRDLCQQLQAQGVPFVLYSGQTEVDHECSASAVIQKPAPPADIVTRVEEMLK